MSSIKKPKVAETLTMLQYYTEVLGHEVRYLFMPSYGLLLRDDLHHSFDRGEIALYPKVSHSSTALRDYCH